MDPEQLIQMIVQTKQWFDSRIQQLEMVANSDESMPIKFEGEDGEQVELPAESRKAFVNGVKLALEVFGDFPISIGPADEGEDSEEE